MKHITWKLLPVVATLSLLSLVLSLVAFVPNRPYSQAPELGKVWHEMAQYYEVEPEDATAFEWSFVDGCMRGKNTSGAVTPLAVIHPHKVKIPITSEPPKGEDTHMIGKDQVVLVCSGFVGIPQYP